ncbi:RagB/SusD family nutrient uptake outer membrane protein [Flavobacterium sp. LB3P21]|uniref:RagB/SusD family nutrient uptake outer membrane protein n=1 Tax=Flavobacterium sp. LB3P21 TaxID=3401719 RepID=UPI003AAACEDF
MKYINPIIVAFIVCWLYSCESFTEVDTPQSQLTSPAVFENVTTANAAMANIYARLREDGMVTGTPGGLSSLMANYSDEMRFYGSSIDMEQFNNHTIVPSNSLIASLWNGTYGEIYAANAILEGLANSTAIPDEDKARLTGEALFLRGYLHFYLVNVFGDVPYVTATDYNNNSTIFKTPQAQVWQNIISDLTQAESVLPENYPVIERVRINKAVATAMLSRVYLYTEDWVKAEEKASEVIANNLYSWEGNPAKEFLRESPAIIWALHPGVAGVNTKEARTFVFSSGPPIRPSLANSLVSAFESNDLRRNLWVKTVTNSSGTWYCAFKYKKTANTGTSQEYSILFRLAEQYLIRAEAYAHLGNISGAQDDLNKIRTRAGLPSTTADAQESLLTAIAQERRMELFTEQGHRWFDLKRTGKATEVLSAIKPGWQNTQVLLPLPQTELLLNNNLQPQNPGY